MQVKYKKNVCESKLTVEHFYQQKWLARDDQGICLGPRSFLEVTDELFQLGAAKSSKTNQRVNWFVSNVDIHESGTEIILSLLDNTTVNQLQKTTYFNETAAIVASGIIHALNYLVVKSRSTTLLRLQPSIQLLVIAAANKLDAFGIMDLFKQLYHGIN